MKRSKPKARPLIGWREWVVLPDLSAHPLKAKVDTGARTSALHAFGLKLHDRDGVPWVSFEIDPNQRTKTQRAKVSLPVHAFRRVRSSTGHAELRPVIRTALRIGDQAFDIDITLTSRDQMGFRMLLGRAAVRRRFWVDADRSFVHAVPPGMAETRKDA